MTLTEDFLWLLEANRFTLKIGQQCCRVNAIGSCPQLVTDGCQFGASQVTLVVKNPAENAGGIRDAELIPGSGRFPGRGHGNPLQHSCLENPMSRGAWWATLHRVSKSRTWLKQLSMHTYVCQFPFSSVGKFGVSDYIILCIILFQNQTYRQTLHQLIFYCIFFPLPAFFSYSLKWILGSLPKETASLRSLS